MPPIRIQAAAALVGLALLRPPMVAATEPGHADPTCTSDLAHHALELVTSPSRKERMSLQAVKHIDGGWQRNHLFDPVADSDFALRAEVANGLPSRFSNTIFGEPLLLEQDRFALDEMARRGIIEPEEAEFYRQATLKLPEGRLWSIAATGGRDGRRNYLRMVAGQEWSKRGLVRVHLPWEDEFPELARRVASGSNADRYRFEWSRAASIEAPQAMQDSIALMTLFAVRDVQIMGGRIDEAGIFIHATRPGNRRLYERYGFRFIGGSTERPGHAMLRAPLRELYDVHRPAARFLNLGELERATGLAAERLMPAIDEAARASEFRYALTGRVDGPLGTQMHGTITLQEHGMIGATALRERHALRALPETAWDAVLEHSRRHRVSSLSREGWEPSPSDPAYVEIDLPTLKDRHLGPSARVWLRETLGHYARELEAWGVPDGRREIERLVFYAKAKRGGPAWQALRESGFEVHRSGQGVVLGRATGKRLIERLDPFDPRLDRGYVLSDPEVRIEMRRRRPFFE